MEGSKLSSPKRVGIVGSRDYEDEARVRAFVASLPLMVGDSFIVVTGGAKYRTKEWLAKHPGAPREGGVDFWAEDQARIAGWKPDVIEAQWEMYGRAAGMIRNAILVESCDIVYIFWDGKSSGSRNVIKNCVKNKIPYEVFGDADL